MRESWWDLSKRLLVQAIEGLLVQRNDLGLLFRMSEAINLVFCTAWVCLPTVRSLHPAIEVQPDAYSSSFTDSISAS